MLVLRSINRAFRRHRRLTLLAGVLIVLGVTALSTHAALPEHHDAGETVCLCALSIATLGAVAGVFRRPFLTPLPVFRLGPRPRTMNRVAAAAPLSGEARAGPTVLQVLRR